MVPIVAAATDVAGFAGAGGPAVATPVAGVDEVTALGVEGTDALAEAAAAFFANGGRRLYLAEGLDALATVDEIGLVAAPTDVVLPADDRLALMQALVVHAEACGHRLAVVDGPPDATVDEIADFRRQFDSSFAALYHPWLVPDPPAAGPLAAGDEPPALAPSGAVAGILARTAAHVAPANQPLAGVTGVVTEVPAGSRDSLNQTGVNLLRTFPGHGLLVWGARTMSSDPDWKYVNVRRLAMSLERSIDQGTQWAVFEPNAEPLWAAVREAVSDFLTDRWREGAFPGAKPEEAFFVRVDRSTMTQADLDAGRLVGLVGVAPVRPAEFVIIRIGQWTADHDPDGDPNP